MESWEIKLLEDTQGKFGGIPPQWIIFPTMHPLSLGWRMGEGESYMIAWNSWWEEQHFTFEQKVAYFKHYETPKAWLENLIFMLYPEALDESFGDDDVPMPYFKKLEKLGFGSYQDWDAAYHSEHWDLNDGT